MRKLTLDRVAFAAACLVVPMAMLAVMCACNGVFPFGDKTFLAEDLRYQYRDFYEWFIRVLHGDASVLYNLNTGMGTNAWGIYSYYLASPVNLLLPLFGSDNIALFVYVTTSLKLGCMNVAMAWYLRRRFELPRPSAFALALCFTCSTWTISQMCNPQWLDALVLLPLMAWGAFVLVREGRWVPLVATIAASVFACWYTAYMLLAYLLLLFVLEAVAATSEGIAARTLLVRAGQLALCVCAGLGLAAFTFLPTVMQMLRGNAPSLAEQPLWVEWTAVMEGSVLNGWKRIWTPQLFGGTLLIVLTVSLAFNRKTPVRVRVATLVVILFLVYGTKNIQLQVAWSGFRPATGFYNRMSWLAMFTMAWAGAWVLRSVRRRETSWHVVAAGVLGTCAWVAVTYVRTGYDDLPSAVAMAFVALCSGALLVVCGRFAPAESGVGRSYARWHLAAGIALCLLACAELTWSGTYAMSQAYDDFSDKGMARYLQDSRAQYAQLKEHDDGWCRVDKTYTRVFSSARNEGMALGYSSLSTYCSSQNGRAVAFLERMGYSRENEFSVSYVAALPVMDSLLGVRYVSTDPCPAGYADPGLMDVEVPRSWLVGAPIGTARFYENPHALSLGYGVSNDLRDATFVGGRDSFAEQNALVSKMLGRDVRLYVPMQADLMEQSDFACSWSVHVPAGCIGYMRSGRVTGPILQTIDGVSYDDNWRWEHAAKEVADARQGSKDVFVSLMHNNESEEADIPTLVSDTRFYALDWAAYEKVLDELAQRQARVEEFSGNHVALSYEAQEDGMLLVSLPAEPGWSAEVNGKVVDLGKAYDGALMLVPVSQGQNLIKLSFVSPGLFAGVAVSLVTLCACLLVAWIGRRNTGDVA